jgi:hypothetical protein
MKQLIAFPHFEQFVAFVVERYRIWERRQAGHRGPWTSDPILAAYRFCNVYRELDRTTRWIAQHWREPHKDDPHLWFAMVVARLINNPETLAEFSLPGRWNKNQFLRVMHARRDAGLKTFSGAYMIHCGESRPKADYLADRVLDPLWARRVKIMPRHAETLRAFHNRLSDEQDMGSFMSAQVIADIKYVAPLDQAVDWWTFAASGSGSRRGMSYVMAMDPTTRWRESEWRRALTELRILMRPQIRHAGMPPMHAQDLQNCLCEFSKWKRTQLGTGRPKQRFVPREQD